MRYSAILLTGSLLCFSAAGSARQTQAPTTFRAGVDLIQLDVSVLDKDRHPVRGLTTNDFTVLVDGQPRPVVAFKAVELAPPPPPPSAPWMRDVAPDVATNTSPAGRVIVIVVDDGSFWQVDPGTGSAGPTGVVENGAVVKTRATARRVVNELGPDDLTAVVFTENNHTSQSFTSDRQKLLAAIDKAALFPSPSDSMGDPLGLERGACQCGLCSIEALGHVAESLRSLPQQRKIVIYVSAGIVVLANAQPVNAPILNRYEMLSEHCNFKRKETMVEVFRQAQLANVTIQAIDPKGLVVGIVGGNPLKNPTTSRVEFLRTVAETTGGRAVVNNNDMEQQVPAVLEESSSYYLLGVESPPVKEDGAFHAVKVTVNRQDLEVRTRAGYYDPTEKERRQAVRAGGAAALDAAIATPLPKGDFPLTASVAPFATPDGKAVLAIVLNVAHPTQESTRGLARDEEVAVIARAFGPETGKDFGGQRHALDVEWNPTNALAGQYEVFSRLPVPPGRYELRLGLETGDARTASVYIAIEVPDFNGAPLSLSGLVLSATPSPKFAPKEGFNDLMPVIPTARRAFAATDTVTGFLRVYQDVQKFAPATVTTRITDTTNRVVSEAVRPLTGEPAGSTSIADLQVDLPVANLAPGEYLLTVDVRVGNRTARRALRFSRE